MAHRPGFIIPNAGETATGLNRQAEPDAGDFSVLGDENNGVLTGFDYTISSSAFQLNTASNLNVAIIDGEIYRVTTAGGEPTNLSVSLAAGGLNDRFDLVVYEPLSANSNKLRIIQGEVSDNPKFPDIPENVVVIAAITVPLGIATNLIQMSHVVDKRRWVLNGARGSVATKATFLENRIDGADVGFKVLGDGTMTLGSYTLEPRPPAELRISGGDLIYIKSDVTIEGLLSVIGNVTATGQVTGSNLLLGGVNGGPNPTLGQTGSLYQDTTFGRLFIKQPNGQWAEIYRDEYPPGTIIASLLTGQAAVDHLAGSWLLCDGTSWPAVDYPRLVDAFPDWVHGDNIELPDLRGKFLGGSGGIPNVPVGAFDGSNSTTITEEHLPPHTHLTGTSTKPAGFHNHGTGLTGANGGHSHSMSLGGQHQHHIADPGHAHNGANHGYDTPSPMVHMRWGGQYKVDTLNVDADHGPNVDFSWWTIWAETGIQHTDNDGMHNHLISSVPNHDHQVALAPQSDHVHDLPIENPVGQGHSFDNRPSFVAVNWYIKAA